MEYLHFYILTITASFDWFKFCTIDWDAVIGISTTVIAGLAVGVSVWSSKQQRKHNELTVKPILRITHDIDPGKGKAVYYLKNLGYGPAIIKEVLIQYNGVKIDNNRAAIKQMLNIEEITDFKPIIEGTVIPIGYNERWINLFPKMTLDDNRERSIASMHHIRLTIYYKSIYDIDQKPCHKDKVTVDDIKRAFKEIEGARSFEDFNENQRR